MQRQSSIADRSVALLELSEIQRDSNYEETKLIVKYKQGKEAGSAFDRQRRAPAVRVGGLLFLTGFVFMASTFFTDAPSWFGELFAAVGLGPGLTVAFLALLPGDHASIKRVARGVIGFSAIYGLLQLAPVPRLLKSMIDNDCVDYRGKNVPCWCSPLQVIGILLRVSAARTT